MGHVILLGDSIFDNARYVPDRPAVVEQLQRELPRDWRATLLAIDGSICEDVAEQLRRLPADATHLVVSTGGNDALGESPALRDSARTVADGLTRMQEIRTGFRRNFRDMLRDVAALGKPTAVCTIYDSVPGLESAAVAALALFNDVIFREAFAAGLPVVDLRVVCTQAGDYSHVSPIEPSHVGGAKIAHAIAQLLATHDFTRGRSSIYH